MRAHGKKAMGKSKANLQSIKMVQKQHSTLRFPPVRCMCPVGNAESHFHDSNYAPPRSRSSPLFLFFFPPFCPKIELPTKNVTADSLLPPLRVKQRVSWVTGFSGPFAVQAVAVPGSSSGVQQQRVRVRYCTMMPLACFLSLWRHSC